MATTPTLLSLAEYLKTSYKPDCDYIDGELEERNVGERAHGLTQTMLAYTLMSKRKEWGILPIVEQRIQVKPGSVRICDVCVLRADAPNEEVVITPPLLCIEILSPEDRIPRAKLVLADYLAMGVAQSWLLDPRREIAYTFDDHGLHLVSGPRIELAGTPIHLILPDLFTALD